LRVTNTMSAASTNAPVLSRGSSAAVRPYARVR
jgi:hypothetical protein